MRLVLCVTIAGLALSACSRPTPANQTPIADSGAVDMGSDGSVGADGLFHPSEEQKREWAADDAKPTIPEAKAAELCSVALERRTGLRPSLTLQETFPDGSRFYVDGEPGSETSKTNCFIEKDGAISKLRG